MRTPLLIFLILAGFIPSCIKPPSGPGGTDKPASREKGAYILCEGLWGLDNASLSRYDIDNNVIDNLFFQKINSGQRLGDLASDIVVWKDITLISVTTTGTIELLETKTGKSLNRLIFESGRAPRKLAIINDSLAAVTDLLNHSICIFNPYSLRIIADNIKVGPAPEGIAYADDVLLVVNSGYGDYLANRPKTGTVSIVDIASLKEIGNFYAAPNPIEILVNSKLNRFYVSYNHLPSLKDSVGGIVEFDLSDLKELRRLTSQVRSMTLSSSGDSLLFLGAEGVEFINLGAQEFSAETIIKNPNKNDVWYSLASSVSGDIWIGNAQNYQITGELLIYDKNNYKAPKRVFSTGVNPNKIVFYDK